MTYVNFDRNYNTVSLSQVQGMLLTFENLTGNSLTIYVQYNKTEM